MLSRLRKAVPDIHSRYSLPATSSVRPAKLTSWPILDSSSLPKTYHHYSVLYRLLFNRPLVGQDQWALHVPLGKLHTERLVPVDDDVRTMIRRILTLRTISVTNSPSFLLPRSQSRTRVYHRLSYALSCAAKRAGCSHHVTCH